MTIMQITISPKKLPVKRAFTGRLVGMPPEEVTSSVPVTPDVAQVLQTVNRVIDAAGKVKLEYAPERDEQVRQAVSTALSPVEGAPVKRQRGRPRKYAGDTVQKRERNRKRDERDRAKSKLEKLLEHFELKLESEIPPGLKTKYEIEVNTYRELLDSDRVQAKMFKEITRELKIIGVIKTPGSGQMSDGKYMTDAPHAKGLLVLSGKPETIHGLRQSRERGLSKPDDRADDNFAPPESLLSDGAELPAGDRRRAEPLGHGPDDRD
jgi:hypothetical protein